MGLGRIGHKMGVRPCIIALWCPVMRDQLELYRTPQCNYARPDPHLVLSLHPYTSLCYEEDNPPLRDPP